MKHPSKEIESNPIPFIINEYEVDERTLPLVTQGTDNNKTRELNVFEDLVDEMVRSPWSSDAWIAANIWELPKVGSIFVLTKTRSGGI